MPTKGRWATHIKISDEERKLRNSERTRKWYRQNPDKYKARVLRKYDLSLNEYKELLSINNENCIICDSKCPSGRSLALDHDHKTGTLRGLLCINCNKGLGNFKDNIGLLVKAIEYLETSTEVQGRPEYAINKISLKEGLSKECGD